jgi:hypothetical protein
MVVLRILFTKYLSQMLPDRMSNKKPGLTKGIILRQLGSLGLLRPVAFRPLLTEGLALSENN